MIRIPRISRRTVSVGAISLGGRNPIRVQSMTNTPTLDIESTLDQIHSLEAAGCELFRIAVSNRREATAFAHIRERTNVPLIADIQYNHRLAIECLDHGADKVRINPGNLGPEAHLRAVLTRAAEKGKAVRIGINSGSLDERVLDRFGGPTPEAMLISAMKAVAVANELDFDRLVISMKSSGVLPTIEAYRLIARETDYPLHLGITEAGSALTGAVKSAIGIGILLHEGLGDTIRVSLSAPPETEIKVAYDILRALALRKRGPEVISCPTCSRTQIDIISMVRDVEDRLRHIKHPLTVAVMGCYVNGPGEAREADVGIAGGAGRGAIFKKGNIVREVKEKDCLDALFEEINGMLDEGLGGQDDTIDQEDSGAGNPTGDLS